MTLLLFRERFYHADDWNTDPFHTCSLMANLQWLCIKCVTRTEEPRFPLRDRRAEILSFAIQLPGAKKL